MIRNEFRLAGGYVIPLLSKRSEAFLLWAYCHIYMVCRNIMFSYLGHKVLAVGTQFTVSSPVHSASQEFSTLTKIFGLNNLQLPTLSPSSLSCPLNVLLSFALCIHWGSNRISSSGIVFLMCIMLIYATSRSCASTKHCGSHTGIAGYEKD